jgi:dipeptidyl aminopeptidase/acylaminoacyl peptidase
MKPIKIQILVFILCCLMSIQVNSQAPPVKIDLFSNGNKLNAEVYPVTSDKYLPAIILLHGYPGREGDLLGLGKKLSSLGIVVLIFNYQGTWSSEGEFSFENSMEDVGTAIKFLKKKENIGRFLIDTSNIVVGGHSLGGAMALTAAIYNTEIKRIISIAGADESVFGRKMLADQGFRDMFEPWLKTAVYPEGPVKFNFESHQNYLFSNLDRFDQVKHAEALKNKDILYIGGWKDQGVILEEHIIPLYRKLQELNANNVEIIVFNTDHEFKNVREELTEKIYNWIITKD